MIPLWLLACQLTATVAADVTDEAAAPMVPVAVCRYSFGADQDRDFDGIPDGWTRRKGPEFPRYVKAGLDQHLGHTDETSLRIQANGGAAAYYSPFVRIDGLHTFYFEGYIRTAGLQHDAAVLSISLLNHQRQRVQRILSKPVLGDQAEWVHVRIGPIVPDSDVALAVIGCHLAPGSGDRHDISGSAWFDDLSLGRLPRLELDSDFLTHFLNEEVPLRITSRVSGLDEGFEYDLELVIRDLENRPVAQTTQQLTAQAPAAPPMGQAAGPEPTVWEAPRQPPGFYRVTAVLKRDGTIITTQRTTLTVLKLVSRSRPSGEFGWSLGRDLPPKLCAELPEVAAQAGINWVKYPLWQSFEEDRVGSSGHVASMFDRLAAQKIEPIGVFAEPPAELRGKFARQWHGVAEVFRLPPSVWRSSLEPVVARFSSNVHYWQFGGDLDSSFVGLPDLPQTLNTMRGEVRRISLNASVGLPWPGVEPISPAVRPSFWSLSAAPETTASASAANGARWHLLQTSQLTGETFEQRAGQLARQMVAAKVAGAPAIFVDDVYHPEFGLLKQNGAPAELFLPWRTFALALQGAEYLGSFQLLGGSRNAVFVQDDSAVVVLWSDEPLGESLYLGESPLLTDLWGRTQPLVADATTGEHTVDVGPIPKLIVNCSAPIARWRLAAQLELGKMRSEFGGHKDAVLGRNTFPQGVSGTVSLVLPREWEAEPREWTIQAAADEAFRFPVFLTAPPDVPLGEHPMSLDFRIDADRPYRFRVYKPYTVGLGDVTLEVIDRKLPDGRLEIEQVVTNRTRPSEVFDFRCSLFVPDARRQKLQITKLGQGLDRKFYYLPDADSQRGKKLWLRLEQDGGRRVLNYRWTIGESW
jgi:hypothetical protein